MTPGAVTAHIKALEASLGAALFDRSPRGVGLTAVGTRSLPGFVAAFDAMAGAVQVLRAEAAPQVVHIATLPAIAQLWLSPRLPALRAAAPQIEVSITAMEAPPNLKRAPYDLSLFYGNTGDLIAPDVIFPVCSPQVALRLLQPGDLRKVSCLSDTSWSQDWAIWAKAAMPQVPFTPRGPVFSLYALAVEEAAGGAGVVIGHQALIARHLAAGRLVAPFSQFVMLPGGLRLWAARALRPGSAPHLVAKFLQKVGRLD